MKCDHLIGRKFDGEVYILASDVIEAVAELKAKLQEEREFGLNRAKSADHEIGKMCAEITELKAKLEDAKATAYAESVDAGMRERRLKRALFLAHAYKAKFKRWWLHLALDCEAREIHTDTKTINRIRRKIGNCEKSERKCRAKAEEYK